MTCRQTRLGNTHGSPRGDDVPDNGLLSAIPVGGALTFRRVVRCYDATHGCGPKVGLFWWSQSRIEPRRPNSAMSACRMSQRHPNTIFCKFCNRSGQGGSAHVGTIALLADRHRDTAVDQCLLSRIRCPSSAQPQHQRAVLFPHINHHVVAKPITARQSRQVLGCDSRRQGDFRIVWHTG
jgi:hypothetical protein